MFSKILNNKFKLISHFKVTPSFPKLSFSTNQTYLNKKDQYFNNIENIKQLQKISDQEAFERCIHFGYMKGVTYYSDKPNVDIHNKCGIALICAASQGHLEMVKFLINKGAVVNAMAVCESAINGHFNVVKFFKEIKEEAGEWALICAAESNHIEIVKYLCENGVNKHIHHDMPLRLARKNGHNIMVKYLLDCQ